MRVYLALFKSNMRLTLRDRGVLFFNFLFPLIFFFAYAELFHTGQGSPIGFFVATVLVMVTLGNGLWGAGMRSVQEREANILRRYKVTPITPVPILMAAMASGLVLFLPVILVLLGIAHFGYKMPWPEHWLALIVMALIGVCALRSIGLILAAVTNTMAETTIAIQIVYLPMLFAATVPAAILPKWAQTVAEFLPGSRLVKAFQGVMLRHETFTDNLPGMGALLLTAVVGVFLATKLFRWEKGERIPPRNKLWVLAVMLPFVVLGAWRAHNREHLDDNAALYRTLQRSGTFLIRDARIFTGDGTVIEKGGVLVREGKIAEIYRGASPDPEKAKFEVVEGAGKTLLPGLIDTHVHLSATGGITADPAGDSIEKTMERAAAALLYSGITTARSAGDPLDSSLKLRKSMADGAKQGSRLAVLGPMFTAEGGHGTEFIEHLPAAARDSTKVQMVRTPKTPEEARQQVRELKARGIDGIKAILEAGWGEGMLFDRMDLLIVRAAGEEAHAQRLPLVTHTGDARDVADAVEIGSASVEHGSWRDEIPDRLLERMARDGVFLDPTLCVAEAYSQYFSGRADGLSRSLVQQVLTAKMLESTRDFVASGKGADTARAGLFERAQITARANLLRAWHAGVPLAMGTDAGNPLVFHGASLHRELQLWVQAGIPVTVALQAATVNAARLLGAQDRIGAIRPGMDADLLLVDGNPLEDIAATERISLVVAQGERIRRTGLFDQK
jgi:imidazolonepropionase-like amidohydrolase/ABC-type multidrug transport system permease subunit